MQRIEMTVKEEEVYKDLANGLSIDEISEKRNVRPSTIKGRIKKIRNHLGCLSNDLPALRAVLRRRFYH